MPKPSITSQETEFPNGDLDQLHELISQRAYEIFLSRDAEAGTDLDDWLRAERELSGRDRES